MQEKIIVKPCDCLICQQDHVLRESAVDKAEHKIKHQRDAVAIKAYPFLLIWFVVSVAILAYIIPQLVTDILLKIFPIK